MSIGLPSGTRIIPTPKAAGAGISLFSDFISPGRRINSWMPTTHGERGSRECCTITRPAYRPRETASQRPTLASTARLTVSVTNRLISAPLKATSLSSELEIVPNSRPAGSRTVSTPDSCRFS